MFESSRPGPVSLHLVLPEGARVTATFFDDGSCRDLTPLVADLLLEFLLRPVASDGDETSEGVEVLAMALTDGVWEDCALTLRDADSGACELVPGSTLPGLLAAAVAMALRDATGRS